MIVLGFTTTQENLRSLHEQFRLIIRAIFGKLFGGKGY
jgi:hypothetical protein